MYRFLNAAEGCSSYIQLVSVQLKLGKNKLCRMIAWFEWEIARFAWLLLNFSTICIDQHKKINFPPKIWRRSPALILITNKTKQKLSMFCERCHSLTGTIEKRGRMTQIFVVVKIVKKRRFAVQFCIFFNRKYELCKPIFVY